MVGNFQIINQHERGVCELMFVPHVSETVLTECPLCGWSGVTKNANRDSFGYYSTCPDCMAMYDITQNEHDEIKEITEKIRNARREAIAAQKRDSFANSMSKNKNKEMIS